MDMYLYNMCMYIYIYLSISSICIYKTNKTFFICIDKQINLKPRQLTSRGSTVRSIDPKKRQKTDQNKPTNR